jgi:hypothetical protein
MTPIQQALLLAGLFGLVLGVLLTLAGLHELSHRGQYEPPEPSEPVEPRPVRGRW